MNTSVLTLHPRFTVSRCSRAWTEQPPLRGRYFYIDVFDWPVDSFSLNIVLSLLNIHWLKIHGGLFLLLTLFSMLGCGPQMRSMSLTTCLKSLIWWAGCCLYPSGFICQWSHAIMSVSNHASNAGINKRWVGALSAHTRGWKDSLSPAFVGFREFWQLCYATWWLTCILRAVT